MRIGLTAAILSSLVILWRLRVRARDEARRAALANATRELERLVEEAAVAWPWDKNIVFSVSTPIEKKSERRRPRVAQ